MGFDTNLTRAEVLRAAAGIAVLGWLSPAAKATQSSTVTEDDLRAIERALGLSFSDAERKAALAEVRENLSAVKDLAIPYGTPPSVIQKPQGRMPNPGTRIDVRPSRRLDTAPERDDDIAFLTVAQLGSLIKAKKLSPVRLTDIYLQRLKKYNPALNCVVTLNDEAALAQAAEAEREIQSGKYRGPLHGIPYGIKDLFSTRGMRTTWGAEMFRDQIINHDATVVRKLKQAGAILVAKLSLGALAMDDKWFGGQTKNPWNPTQGSSGSSAGSACAMAAGLCGFTIGTETLGSIMSPSQRCRVTGLRPTFGRVSRDGAMALSWTMDKVGPICRTAEDCLLVLAAICGSDPLDPSCEDRPLVQPKNLDLRKLKIAMLDDGRPLDASDANHPDWLAPIHALGIKPGRVKITMPEPATMIGLSVEAATAFDSITRNGEVNQLTYSLWPQIFRAHRYFTAVEYLQSLRQRTIAQMRFEEEFGEYDLIIAPDRGAQLLFITNLSGHPQLYLPVATKEGRSVGISIVGRLFDEAMVCALGDAIQRVTSEWSKRPAGFTSA